MKSGEMKLFAAILTAAIILVGVAVYPMITGPHIGGPDKPPGPNIVPLDRKTLVPAGSHILGNPNAPCTIVEFGDYLCGSCKKSIEPVEQIVQQHNGQINLVFHHYHLPNHKNSARVAIAAAAAAEQGKFWEMHRALYQNQSKFETDDKNVFMDQLTKTAADAKLDVIAFRSALTGERARNAVEKDQELAGVAGIQSTPTFYFISPKGQTAGLYSIDQLKDWVKDPKHLS